MDGDPSQLHQMIVNLCIDANEAMQQGGRLTVETTEVALDEVTARRWELPPGSYVRMTVSDSGIGITEAVRQRIFRPFFTTKAGGEVSGTGLGLSTVYGVVHLHRGAIRVESRPGAPAPARGSGCILVVEDEEMLPRLATTALTRLGYSTITASDGIEVMQLFDAHHHELSQSLISRGAVGLLSKPYRIGALSELLARFRR